MIVTECVRIATPVLSHCTRQEELGMISKMGKSICIASPYCLTVHKTKISPSQESTDRERTFAFKATRHIADKRERKHTKLKCAQTTSYQSLGTPPHTPTYPHPNVQTSIHWLPHIHTREKERMGTVGGELVREVSGWVSECVCNRENARGMSQRFPKSEVSNMQEAD